jgi:hypothetical protein
MAKQRRSMQPPDPKRSSPTPKIPASRLPPHPARDDPAHEEWRVDEASDESFPASDPSAPAQHHRSQSKKK